MREVLLSHDGPVGIYRVPDPVAEHLEAYCLEFSMHWIWETPEGARLLRTMGGQAVALYGAQDFIDYLNAWVFPQEPSFLVQELDWYDYELPEAYADFPRFNF